MARTAQTAGLSRPDVYHTQPFTDHAGQPALRVRRTTPEEPIPTNFHTKPSFTFQVYITIPLDLDERSTKRRRLVVHPESGERTTLTDLIDYVESGVADEAQRPEPIWEIYTAQKDAFECVEHQRREIAYRKAKREDPTIPPIPKVAPCGDFRCEKMGFVIIIDSDNFKAGVSPNDSEGGSQGPLWVYLDRRFPSKISWKPRLRLEADPEMMVLDDLDLPEIITILPERVDATFERIQNTDQMGYNLGRFYFASCAPPDPPSSVQEKMDVGWDEDEGAPDAEDAVKTEDAITALQSIAARLSVDDFHISRPNPTNLIISNVEETLEPDLRYIIYVPFLRMADMGDKLENVASAFTYEVISRFSGKKKKTFSFEFCKPPSKSLSSILETQKERNDPENYIGALVTFPNDNSENNDSSERSEEHSTRTRAHPISRTEHANENNPAKVNFEPYRTFIVVLEQPDFHQVEGGVLFLLADGGKYNSEPESCEEPELENYVEMQVWRSAGMDEVARRLQMIWGGVKWEQGMDEEKSDRVDLGREVEEKEGDEV